MADAGGVVFKDNLDARIAPTSGGKPSEHAPLPYGDDGDQLLSGPIVDLTGLDRTHLSSPADIGMVYYGLNAVADCARHDDAKLKTKIAELRTEIAGLELTIAKSTATVAELKAEVGKLSFVSERLSIDHRGPQGHRGERGRDGRDGPPGVRGEQGPIGAPAPMIAAWEPRPERFETVPVYADGSRGPPMALLSLFQAYDAAVTEIEDRDLTEAAHVAREIVEREVEASRWAR